MKRIGGFIVMASVLIFCASIVQAEVTDPYTILNKYYDARGGLDKLRALKTMHITGNVDIVGTGLKGTFEEWDEAPVKQRQNVDLGIFKQQSGDNGEYPWTVDHNGKLQIVRDESRLKQRTVDSLMAVFVELDPQSKYFTVTYEGIDTAGGKNCYEVKIANSINTQIVRQYFDTTDFLMVKQVTISPQGDEQHTIYSDYRPVDGIVLSFRQESRAVPTGMVQTSQITSAEANVPIDESLFQPPATDVRDFHFTNGKSAEDIPFQFIENHIYIPVEMGGHTRLWVLDTGAGISVVMTRFADELGLKPEGKMKGMGAGNLVDVSFTNMPAFSLPGIEFDPQKAAIIDINWLFDQWIGKDVAGILGYDFLSRMTIKVDYAHEKISFFDPDSFSYSGPGVVIDAPLNAAGSFNLPVTIDSKYGGDWFLDLGAGGMAFHYPFAKKNGLLDRPGISSLGFGAGGSHKVKNVRFKTIEFAGFTLPHPIVSMLEGEVKGAFSNEETTGNIGNTLLRHFVIYLDYKHGKVIVEKGADFDHVFPVDHSGLQVINKDGKLEVLFVSPDTPAEKAGFQVGDTISSVNGIGAEYLGGIVAFKKMLQAAPGTKYDISVIRNGATETHSLVLKDLYAQFGE